MSPLFPIHEEKTKDKQREVEGAKYNGDDHHKQKKRQRHGDVDEEDSAWRFNRGNGWLSEGKRLTNLTWRNRRHVCKIKLKKTGQIKETKKE